MAIHDSARYSFHIVDPFRKENKSAGVGEEEYDGVYELWDADEET